jgi:3-phenylpropionate/cinnamic acid dioxygenase small subunit
MSHDLDPKRLAAMLCHFEVQRFLFDEAALLDARRFEDWLSLFTDDARYFMPIRRTRIREELDKEFTQPGEMAFFDDTKGTLTRRIKKLATGRSWSEDPPSRTRHLITNVRVVEDRGEELDVESNFHLYRTRLKSEETSWIGSRKDTLRTVDGQLRIARRTILLEQTVLLSSNLSNFF